MVGVGDDAGAPGLRELFAQRITVAQASGAGQPTPVERRSLIKFARPEREADEAEELAGEAATVVPADSAAA